MYHQALVLFKPTTEHAAAQRCEKFRHPSLAILTWFRCFIFYDSLQDLPIKNRILPFDFMLYNDDPNIINKSRKV